MNRKMKVIVTALALCLVSAVSASADTLSPDAETEANQMTRNENELYTENDAQTSDLTESDSVQSENTVTEIGSEEAAETDEVAEEDAVPASDEMADSDVGEETEDAPDASDSEGESGLSLVAVGKGDLTVDDSGSVSCTPQDGYEIISITADRDAGGVKKGNEIPETGISDIEFEEDTTITAVFRRTPEDNVSGARPESAAAAFGNN